MVSSLALCLILSSPSGLHAVRGESFPPLPYGGPEIDYFANQSRDRVAEYIRRHTATEAATPELDRASRLRGLLKSLDVSVESQLLVFSRTAFNPRLVSPQNPRAIYFSDDAYVAYVPGAAAIEIAALDPLKGAIFYTLPVEAEDTAPLRFRRETRCLACHASSNSLNVPGLTVRSFSTDELGEPIDGYSRITHETPFGDRFGGWYVTGTHSGTHRGNRFGSSSGLELEGVAPTEDAESTAPPYDPSLYLSTHSDLVAQLIFNHQVHGQNLLIRVAQEECLNASADRPAARDLGTSAADCTETEEALVRYLLFADEAPLPGPIRGTSGFATIFQERGPHDPHRRSLRQLDLQDRLFRYRLSYLIYSSLFDGLPDRAKRRIYRRLWQILAAVDPPAGFEHLSASEREAILSTVRETKGSLPAYWHSKKDSGEEPR